jgi:1-deoxy-D-xylulose-5-phosphate reductoisomerase
MRIPIFNSLYSSSNKKIKSKKLDFQKLNNLKLKKIDKKRFPIVKSLDKLDNNNSLFETVMVAANDCLVDLFLDKKIRFTDISKILLKILSMSEFKVYKKKTPKNVEQITKLFNYVSFKINNMSI